MKLTTKTITSKLKKQLGTLQPNDIYHFELLINSWDVYLKACEEINSKGITIDTAQRIFVNPACNVRNESWKQIVKLSEAFGIKPINREQIEDEEDGI